MKYRKLKADQVFDGRKLLQDHVLILQEDGTVEQVVPLADAGDNIESIEGILSPGFINCHCHLELSHLKGAVPAHTGLVDFLISVIKNRRAFQGNKEEPIKNAGQELQDSGTVGVADICNTPDAIIAKKESPIRWHNLVEVINFNDESLLKQIAGYEQVLGEHKVNKLAAVLVPHAPYSISPATYRYINEHTAGQIISIHNQETAAEDELFKKGAGDFIRLYKEFGNEASPFPISGKSSLQTWLPHFNNGQTILLVHNTFISEEDILFANKHAAFYGLKLVYCLCPNANLYIENTLPPVDLLLKHNCTIVLGTDSYSSNWKLNMGSEIRTIKECFPGIELETIFQWATANGATAMQWNDLGAFEKGKKPGVVLLDRETFLGQRLI